MPAPGRILLVSCYELGRQPLGVASPLASLDAAGFAAEAIDLAVEPLAPAQVAGAQLIAIATPMHTALRIAVEAARDLRRLAPQAHLCFFGLYAHLNAAWLLEPRGEGRPLADSVIGGEVEGALVRLAQALAAGDPAAEVPGVATRARLAAPVLERLPLRRPLRERLPAPSRYAALLEGEVSRIAGSLEATRGCLHLCRHCPIVPVYGGRLFVVPSEVVLADAAQQVAAGVSHFTFADPDFLNAPTHTLRIARDLHAAWPQVTFDVTAKVQHLLRHERLLPELRALGCAFVVSALESLSQRVLDALDKGHTAADIDRLVNLLDAAALPLRPSLVPFTPWSTLADILALFAWLARRDLVECVDPVQLSIRLLVPPGSRLLELSAGPLWPGPLDPEALSHRWQHEDRRLDDLQRALAARAAEGARSGEGARETFAAMRALAHATAGVPVPVLPAELAGPRRDHPPRLAEAWFC